ncbi:hypothetical protein GLOTRDRAFT_37120 [Gloeophyllum trabeum ATCC 11539]|uniref:Uncharacterized protein n=1 Tax=Gloeophyllum trabeum (strain ATCC 11539 / FP-39264 / Madison 617) TaxID=670483 RepID=S7RXP8_GLOTA|nr:uncharacterized protein GLOTRDRAFT_37120 [Gloeophyllum trabeum ATCC 11539]EPQ58144.1 hypothetical protein GLOTRDRAFT_37120 [Gloeophyllum trabeum ATCC 11539]
MREWLLFTVRHSIANWLEQLPLQTAQRVMHVVWPHTIEWEIQHEKSEDVDNDLFQYFYWSQSAASPMREPNVAERSVVIAFQPPWILSPQDIQSFVKLNSFPSFEMVEEQDRYYQSAQRVWAKVWDVCFNKRCPWFVLSSGCDWVFGAFTPGWTRAFVSPVISMTQDNPSPLECLVYWLASANGIPNAWMIPKVGERPLNTTVESPCIAYDLLPHDSEGAMELALLI